MGAFIDDDRVRQTLDGALVGRSAFRHDDTFRQADKPDGLGFESPGRRVHVRPRTSDSANTNLGNSWSNARTGRKMAAAALFDRQRQQQAGFD